MIRQLPTSEVVPHPPIAMEVVTDPQELAQARAQREQFDRNSNRFKAFAMDVYEAHPGQYVCVAGQEVFVGDTVHDAVLCFSA